MTSKTRKIRATLVVEFDYDNALLTDGELCDQKIKQVIADAEFLPCRINSGTDFSDDTLPVISEKKVDICS